MSNLDFGSIDALNNSIGEDIIEVNVPGEGDAIKAPHVPGQNDNKDGDPPANEPPATTTAAEGDLIEIPDSVMSDNSTKGSPQSGSTATSAHADSPSDSNILAFAKALNEQGVLTDIPEEFTGEAATVEGLLGLVKAQVNNSTTSSIEDYKKSLPPAIHDLINNYQEGVPLDKMIGVKSNQMKYASISEEQMKDPEVQKQLVAQDLANRGYSKEKIDARIKLFEDSEVLEQESNDAIVTLRAAEDYNEEQIKKQAQIDKQKSIEDNQKDLESIKSKVDGLKEIVPGRELNDVTRAKLYESMTKVVSNTEDGRPMNSVMVTRKKDPVQFEMTLHYLHSLGVFDGDFSKLIETQTTNAVQDLKRTLQSNTDTLSSGGGVKAPQEGSILSALKMFGEK